MVFHFDKDETLNHETLIPFDKPQKLRTLYLHHHDDQYYHYGKLEISAGFVSPLQGLRVLQLRCLGMRKVPNCIGYQLQQLRYLDLSENPFRALPNSICRSYNLQALRLGGCRCFRKWPRDVTKLVSLRHLELRKCERIQYMPRGLRQLSSLQTLEYFVVVAAGERKKAAAAGIGELHGLNHELRGKLVIRRLGEVRDAIDAEEANLNDKSELQSLELNWESHSGRGRCLEDEKRRIRVLENLQPHPNLKELVIKYYVGIEMPLWTLSSSLLPHLTELKLWRCYNLKCLPLIGEFPCLKNLQLDSLKSVESICNKVVEMMGNNNGGGEGKPLVLFPSLEKLDLINMPNLERWTISVEAATMTGLTEEEEKHEGEEESVAAAAEEEEAQNNNLHLLSSSFPRLTHLTFSFCNKLTTVPILSVGGINHLTSLQTLRIDGPENILASLLDCPAPATLERLNISDCPNLVRFSDCFIEHLKSLSELRVSGCEKLTSLPEGIRHLIKLKLLRIIDCSALTTLPVGLGILSSLEKLEIWGCSNLSSLPEGIQHLTALKKLEIQTCPGLKTLPEGLGSLSSLEELGIQDCSNLSSLPEGIQHLTALKKLEIEICPGLKTLPEGLGSLSSLEKLTIWGCSNLSSLREGIQHLTALNTLKIISCPGLKTLPEGLGSLSSLEELWIDDCSNLSSLPEGIQHLTALKMLLIEDCSNLSSLPIGIQQLESRGVLGISNCPKLSWRHFLRSLPKRLS
ncbi:putative disease resistance protein RGA3 [Telopea speciosissima]|uniref:putative disease resistance protein RGA3 n=1 Tax=Telopea speciosissima TaxID=54955 RepID=UPI001CC3A386|nr:putative disease resistance protein RGA3 [Telopea speciosissima]